MKTKVISMLKLIFVSAFLIPVFSIAQNCKYDKDEYDKFQKTRKIEKQVKVVKTFNRGNGYLTILLCKYGDNTFFRLYTASDKSITVGKSDAVIFLLDNDETVKAFPDEIYSSNYNGARQLFEGTYNFESDSSFEKLKHNSAKSIRIYYNSVYKDFDIKDKLKTDLSEASKCF